MIEIDNIVKKIGLGRIAHFGIGGTVGAAGALMFLYSLPMSDGVLALTLGSVNVPFIISYVFVGMMAWFKVIDDATPDKWNFIASILGVVFVHVASLLGWMFHYGNGHDLITTPWGWVIFGIVFAVLAFFWIRWVVKFYKKK